MTQELAKLEPEVTST